jgi:hypothetical protein
MMYVQLFMRSSRSSSVAGTLWDEDEQGLRLIQQQEPDALSSGSEHAMLQ